MGRFRSEGIALAIALAMASTTSVLAADSATPGNAPAREVMTPDGRILVTPAGMTLYGGSQCDNVPKTTQGDGQGEFGQIPVVHPEAQKTCIDKFPPYLADAGAQATGEFALVDRKDGKKQWTWRGKPLHLSIKDHNPGDRNGANLALGGRNRGRGMAFASVDIDLPANLRFIRMDDSLGLATENRRPVYTPKNKSVLPCKGCEELFKPITAPEIAKVSGDWSIVEAGDGRKQYAYQGKPLYAAPDSLKEYEIAEAGGWEPVLYFKGPGRPAFIGTRPTMRTDVYTNKEGLTLYTFGCTAGGDAVSCNDPGDPAGYWVGLCGLADECARRWKIIPAKEGDRPIGDWSIVEWATPLFTDPRGFTYPPASPRVKVWAYKGSPVFTYYLDKEPSDYFGDSIAWLGFSRFGAVHVPGS